MSNLERPLIIFGDGPMAELAHFYFTGPAGRHVMGFTVDDAWCDRPEFLGMPLIPWSGIANTCPPDTHEVFISVGYSDGNQLREAKYEEAETRGYRLASYVDPSVIDYGVGIGPNCLICEGAVLGPFSRVGRGAIIRTGAQIGHHNRIGDFAYVSPGVVFSGFCEVGARAFIGTGTLVRDGVRIGTDCTVGMGSVVTRDLTEPGVYLGHPARMKK